MDSSKMIESAIGLYVDADLSARCLSNHLSLNLTQLNGIEKTDLDHLTRFHASDIATQEQLLNEDDELILQTILAVMRDAAQAEDSAESLLNAAAEYAPTLVRMIKRKDESIDVVQILMRFISGSSVYHQAIVDNCLLSLAIVFGEMGSKNDLTQVEQFIATILQTNSENRRMSILGITSAMMHVFRLERMRTFFCESRGLNILLQAMDKHTRDIQIMYNCLFCLWLISYNKDCIHFFESEEYRIIKRMTKVIHVVSREKVVRMAMGTLTNLANSPQAIENMIEAGLQKELDALMKRNYKDKDIVDDLENMGEVIEKNFRVLSSFDRYIKELNSTYLDWGPTHTEKFWKEYVLFFEKNDFELLRRLVALLHSTDERTRAVTCFDIGEFARYHHFGKQVLEKMGAKVRVMELMQSESEQVKEQALVCIQKIMIHNWDQLSVQKK
eukprot:CAMPEP_0115038154 /NCGR_PEP_ID=MMETSP0216-20121206/43237_1 /TAXON_ID=223996 /ORGANISM="Protocruzia adherens, Strain Boccale" /LENGTH=442 /DNA_ID=CAMNT_0002418495 /DNA_START=29 /DNA_END=1356 /DNA_ORIENTATION=+